MPSLTTLLLLALPALTWGKIHANPHVHKIKRSTQPLCTPTFAKPVNILSVEDVFTAYWKPATLNASGFQEVDLVAADFRAAKNWRVTAINSTAGTFKIAAAQASQAHTKSACIASSTGSTSLTSAVCLGKSVEPVSWAIACTYCSPDGIFASNCEIKSVPTGLCATHVAGNTDLEVILSTCVESNGEQFPQSWEIASF